MKHNPFVAAVVQGDCAEQMSGSDRNGFVTFLQEKEALTAKTTLNDSR